MKKFSDEDKKRFIDAARKSLENMKWPENPVVEFVEGPMYSLILAWKNKKDRESGDFPNGEWEFRLFPNANDAHASAAAIAEHADNVALSVLLVPDENEKVRREQLETFLQQDMQKRYPNVKVTAEGHGTKVELRAVEGKGRCDFCDFPFSDEVRAALFPCGDFTLADPALRLNAHYTNDWGACPSCRDMILSNDREALLNHAVLNIPEEKKPRARAFFKLIQDGFFEHKGEGYRQE